MRQSKPVLTPEDREKLRIVHSKGLHHAREINRSHILLALKRNISEATIQNILGVGRTAVRRAWIMALHNVARRGARHAITKPIKVGPFAC
jgi:hypothetical protein